jgi:hypothetical protein
MKRLLFIALLAFQSQVAFSEESCKKEKERVDHWNEVLKKKSTEQSRKRHREAKKEFLKCLRLEK